MAEQNDLLTVAEAAAVIQITPEWLHEPIARGELPAVVVDRKGHVRQADLWIETRRIVPPPTARRN